ncbi:hypothetical protein I3842_04G176000 [Carya illinoinensis]|uniref:Prolamin-like domain-containing protein n=1 Tax=Carya illinoinensis TaxID=32201 RepID=A0A922FA62_CARIL|nr:hypothetical protein I3842_04G176000 [Carya illinoinensis]
MIQNLPRAYARGFDVLNHHDDRPDHQRPADEEVGKCMTAVSKIEPCVADIIRAILSFNFTNLGQTCCAAFNQVSEDCHGQHTCEGDHFLRHPWLKNHCSQFATVPAPPSP